MCKRQSQTRTVLLIPLILIARASQLLDGRVEIDVALVPAAERRHRVAWGVSPRCCTHRGKCTSLGRETRLHISPLSPILLAGKRYLVLAFSFAGKQNGGEGTYYSATSDFVNGSVPHSVESPGVMQLPVGLRFPT